MVVVDRAFSGSAAQATLLTAMTPSSPGAGGTITVSDDSGYPSSGKFEIVIDRRTESEENVLINSRAGTTFTIGQRGYDGSVARSHTSGTALVEHDLSGRTVQLFVDHVDDVESDPHSTKLLNNARHDLEARHTFGAAYGTPVTPTDIATAGAAGTGNNPAREDHTHKIGTGAINAAGMFAAGVVDAAALATDSVGTAEIQADAVGTSEIAPLAVTAAEIANDTITATQIAANAVGASELANNAVDTAAIVDDAVTDAKIENDFARGIIAQQKLTASEGAAHTTSGATDMALNNVPVVQGHTYAIHIHSASQFTPGASVAMWHVNLHVNTVKFATLYTAVAETNALTQFPTVEGTVYWDAPATQATDDFTVQVEEFSGTFSFQLTAAADVPRWLTITDLGVI